MITTTINSLIIPWESLNKDTLDALLEEIVTRDGTDYGSSEKTTQQKVTFARNQLQSGYAFIVWNSELESASLVDQTEADRLTRGAFSDDPDQIE